MGKAQVDTFLPEAAQHWVAALRRPQEGKKQRTPSGMLRQAARIAVPRASWYPASPRWLKVESSRTMAPEGPGADARDIGSRFLAKCLRQVNKL